MFSRDNLILIVLFLILLFFGVWRLPQSPATWFDEGINLGIAKSLVTKGVFSLETAPGEFVQPRQFLITSNYPVLLPAALSVRFFGFNLTAARFPMVLFLVLFAGTAYFLVKKLYSKEAALMSLALIVTFTPFYGNGKNVLGEIPGLFYFLCALLFLLKPDEVEIPPLNPPLVKGGRGGVDWRLVSVGFFAGLSAATKPFFLIVPVVILVAEIVCHRSIKRITALVLGGVLPVILWLYTILPSFSLGGLRSAVFYYSNSYASANFGQLIFQNFLRFFTESTPIHFAVLFLVSAAFLLWKKLRDENIKEIEIAFAAFILLTLAFYLKTPGWYRYFFPAHMILFLIFPAALIYLFNKKTAVIVVAFLFLFQFTYTISQRNSSLYNSDEAIIFSKYVEENTSQDAKIFIVNAPSIAFLLNNRQIYQYLQINPVLFFGKNSLESGGQFYPYVITQGDLEDLNFNGLTKTLNAKYKMEKGIGHYNLYRRLDL